MPRRNFLLTLAYEGADFLGWQRLPGKGRSVQGEVEAALARILGESVEITGAGRTDAGVHAEGQAASFHSRTPLSPGALCELLAKELPADIACRSCREVDPRFHARFRAKAKVYRYRLHVAWEPDPSVRGRSFHVRGKLDLEAMRRTAAVMVGEHDFRAFSNSGGGETSRSLTEVRIESSGDFVDMYFLAPGFLTNQVRIMAAVLLEAGQGKLGPEEVSRLLAARVRSQAPGMLGAFGLCLMEVRY